jgi:hypothetical protein
MSDRGDISALEEIVDRQGLQGVLNMLAQICEEKADHIRVSYDDMVTAGSWKRDANRIAQWKPLEN